jgi:pyruvate dehydrogenase E1 component alpha subunit
MAKPATKPKDDPSPAKAKSPPNLGDNSVSPDELKAHYRDMLLIRRFEEKAGQLYGMGLIGGFCHLYIGQEAVVVGMQDGRDRRKATSVITSYRDHGHMLACGMDPKGVMAELTGRSGGYSKGKGGSMHMFSREKSFYGGHGIVGAQVPLGTGLAFATSTTATRTSRFTYFGDGAANQGQVYEAYQHGRALEAAGGLRHREQPLRHGHLGRARLGQVTELFAAARPSASPASRWTAWTCWR